MSKLPPELLEALELAWDSCSKNSESQKQLELAQARLEKVKLLLKEKVHRNSQLESLLKHSTNEFETEMGNAKQHIEGLEMALESKYEQIEALSLQVADLEQSLSEHTNEESTQKIEDLEKQNTLLMAELDNRGSLLAYTQIETRRIDDNYQRLRGENESLVRGNAMLQSRNIQLTQKFEHVSSELVSLKEELQDRERHLEILQRQLRMSEQNVRHLEVVNTQQSN